MTVANLRGPCCFSLHFLAVCWVRALCQCLLWACIWRATGEFPLAALRGIFLSQLHSSGTESQVLKRISGPTASFLARILWALFTEADDICRDCLRSQTTGLTSAFYIPLSPRTGLRVPKAWARTVPHGDMAQLSWSPVQSRKTWVCNLVHPGSASPRLSFLTSKMGG